MFGDMEILHSRKFYAGKIVDGTFVLLVRQPFWHHQDDMKHV